MEIIESYELKNIEKLIELNKDIYNFKKDITKIEAKKIAVSNMFLYLAMEHEEYSCFFEGEYIIENFKMFYQRVNKVIGKFVITVFQMNLRIKKYSNKQGKKLHLMKNYWKWNIDSVYEYIKSGIFSNNPVLITTWNFPNPAFRFKWMFIIGIKKYNNGKIEIETIENGVRQIYSLNEWIEEKSLYKGLMYYK